MRRTLLLISLMLTACTAQVSDLDDLVVDEDACDPRGSAVRGTDLDLQFDGLTPHVNQDIFFAVTVGEERNIEGMMVLAGLDDPDLHLIVPKLLPEGPSELAFWADSDPLGMFNPIPDRGDDTAAIDHQWTRPICPNGIMTFTHTTPFQSVKNAVSTGAIFKFVIPESITRHELFDNFRMWVTVTQLDDEDPEKELQTRAYYRWSPRVPLPNTDERPEPLLFPNEIDPATGDEMPKPLVFQVGGNALGEARGAVDKLSRYHIRFVIDVDDNGKLSGEDFVCDFDRQLAPDLMIWEFMPNLDDCDPGDMDFDPETVDP